MLNPRRRESLNRQHHQSMGNTTQRGPECDTCESNWNSGTAEKPIHRCERNHSRIPLLAISRGCPSWCPRLLPNLESTSPASAPTPEHYAGSVTPWDLERCMKTSGNVFVDARRTDAIEYCFRIKEDLIGDLKKAKHCIEEAIKELEKTRQE